MKSRPTDPVHNPAAKPVHGAGVSKTPGLVPIPSDGTKAAVPKAAPVVHLKPRKQT